MKVKDLLEKIDLGSSVAEFDTLLEKYFIETETFRKLTTDKGDIIAGDKGTGKTALYKILQSRYGHLKELKSIEVIAGFNPAGNPIFQKLAEGQTLTEPQYVKIWKVYIFALVANFIAYIYGGEESSSIKELNQVLQKLGLKNDEGTPESTFTRVATWFKRIFSPKAAELSVSLSGEGVQTFTSKLEFNDNQATREALEAAQEDDLLRMLDGVMRECGIAVWLALDRLDEAFQGFPAAEVPALRALLRTYLDLLAFKQIRLKLFVRKDLFRKVIKGGFVNLTHINARKIEIVWDDNTLFSLLHRRLAENKAFLADLGLDAQSGDAIFSVLFPKQVDVGERKPTTWAWILSRIKDGNGVMSARNLIDLVKKSQEAQLRKEERQNREYQSGVPIIESDSLKRGLSLLSAERVADTLLAEAGEYAELIRQFKQGKAEHDEASLARTLGVSPSEVAAHVQILMEIGFLEQVGMTYKIPMIYRDGLDITQGKAF